MTINDMPEWAKTFLDETPLSDLMEMSWDEIVYWEDADPHDLFLDGISFGQSPFARDATIWEYETGQVSFFLIADDLRERLIEIGVKAIRPLSKGEEAEAGRETDADRDCDEKRLKEDHGVK